MLAEFLIDQVRPLYYVYHMFQAVCKTRQPLRVAEVSYIDVHSRAGLVRFSIVYQKHLKFVRQSNHAVLAVIQRRGFEIVGH